MTEAHEEEESDRDNEENNMPLLHLTKRKRRPIVCEKSPRKRGTKRHRFSLPFSSDQESETGVESDCSNYVPSKAHRFSESRPAFSHSTGFERDTSDNGEMEFAGEPLRMAVIYEQQSWEGEIIAERDMKQGADDPASNT